MATNSKDNFDPKTEIRRLQEGFEPHNLSEKMCEAIKKQKDVDKAIKEVIEESLKKEVNIINAVKNIVIEYGKEKRWNNFLVGLGWVVTLVLAFIGGGYFK